MLKRILFVGGAVALGAVLIALPGRSEMPQDAVAEKTARTEASRAQVALQAALQDAQERKRVLITPDAQVDSDGPVVLLDDGASWLGVESQEVNSDKARELKLPAERGVLLQRIVPDSPAAKAGLKENDVITEINGQRVEGATQFRRMIHEIPAGRNVQFTVWRDGHAQTIHVTLGSSEDNANARVKPFPRAFSFQLPNVEIPEIPDGPATDWTYELMPGGRPRLGIDAEDLSGQFGAYFGAPDGEGVLVREVNTGSAAEKAGLKSGDVIISLNGDRIRSLGDLREKLAGKREEKTVKLGVLRSKSEQTITVELPPPPSKAPRAISRRTNI
ncbi:MAG: PDZ domain-containing protein [Candidatus Acidiferrum sp.]|jgi:serine protease Do